MYMYINIYLYSIETMHIHTSMTKRREGHELLMGGGSQVCRLCQAQSSKSAKGAARSGQGRREKR